MTTNNNQTSPIRFSLIIPAYNEEKFLPFLLDSVAIAKENYKGGSDVIEVIVANNMSTDMTADIALKRGCQVAYVEKRLIAAARNGGAKIAKGDVLCFIDGDSRIHPNTFNAINHLIQNDKVIAGATGIVPDRYSLGIIMTWAMAYIVTFFARVDAGVVFCRRQDFISIGGYNETMDYAEDIQFLTDLKVLGKKRNQHFARTSNAKAITSTRKFDTHGDWHYFTKMPRVGFWMLFNKSKTRSFTNKYWYEDR